MDEEQRTEPLNFWCRSGSRNFSLLLLTLRDRLLQHFHYFIRELGGCYLQNEYNLMWINVTFELRRRLPFWIKITILHRSIGNKFKHTQKKKKSLYNNSCSFFNIQTNAFCSMWSSTEAIDGENNTKYGENNILISIADSERLIVFWFRI